MHVVAQPCVDVKDKACIPACPVDCIYEYDSASGKLVTPTGGEIEVSPSLTEEDRKLLARMVVIHPETCIDCTACVDPCPTDAIFLEDDVPDQWKSFIAVNRSAFQV